MRTDEMKMKDAMKRLGEFGKRFIDSYWIKGSVRYIGPAGNEPPKEYIEDLIDKCQYLQPVVDADGEAWRPVPEHVLIEMIRLLRAGYDKRQTE